MRVSDVIHKKSAKFTIDSLVDMLAKIGALVSPRDAKASLGSATSAGGSAAPAGDARAGADSDSAPPLES